MHKDCIILCHETNSKNELLCLQEINGKAFIEYLANYLRRFHICKIIFSVSEKKEEFKSYINERRNTFTFAYDFAESVTGSLSGQAINQSLQYSDTPDVLIINSHTFFDVNIDDFFAWQQTKMGDVTLALSHQKDTVNYDLAHLNEENFVRSFTKGEENKSGLVLTGMYCMFRPSFLNINFPFSFSFEEEYLKKHASDRDFIGMISDAYFVDLSRDNGIEKATKDFPIIFKEPIANDTNR